MSKRVLTNNVAKYIFKSQNKMKMKKKQKVISKPLLYKSIM